MILTQHAQVRMQQRSIPPLIVDWLDGYGARERAPGSAEIVFFDQQAKKELCRDFGKVIVKRLSPYMNTYMIMKRGQVITVGYRNGHVRREIKTFNLPQRSSAQIEIRNVS